MKSKHFYSASAQLANLLCRALY